VEPERRQTQVIVNLRQARCGERRNRTPRRRRRPAAEASRQSSAQRRWHRGRLEIISARPAPWRNGARPGEGAGRLVGTDTSPGAPARVRQRRRAGRPEQRSARTRPGINRSAGAWWRGSRARPLAEGGDDIACSLSRPRARRRDEPCPTPCRSGRRGDPLQRRSPLVATMSRPGGTVSDRIAVGHTPRRRVMRLRR
jgi:hypothetical protein